MLGQLHGVAAADAVPRAGDDRDLALEQWHLTPRRSCVSSDIGASSPLAPERGHCIFPTLTEPIGEPAPAAALAGVRVLDLATLFPAPMVAAMLGDLGADVVKVEPPGGDPLRVTGAMRGDRTFVWALADRNKRALSVDFDTADGVALVQRLTAVADVVVLNQPPARARTMGLHVRRDRGAQPRRDRRAGHRLRRRRAQRRPARATAPCSRPTRA